MIFRLSMKNLVRMMRRTVLYFLIAMLVTAITSVALLIFCACDSAVATLERDYIFVASLVPRSKSTAIHLRDVKYCLSDRVAAYGVMMNEYEGVMTPKMPEKADAAEAPLTFCDPALCPLAAVEDLFLVPAFFSGEAVITEGTGITDAGYKGAPEIVIPARIAKENGIKVGDTVVKRYYGNSKYIFFEATVVGIYEGDAEKAKAYIPLAATEWEYGTVVSRTDTSEIAIDRADFVLRDREAFSAFVDGAIGEGLDLRRGELVFNNSPYDALLAELQNIRTVALVTLFAVLSAGVGVLIFLTVTFTNARARERTVLSALGMPKRSILLMMLTEIAVILIVAVAIGLLCGGGAARLICEGVNENTLRKTAKAALLPEEKNDNAPSALLREVKLSISLDGAEMEQAALPIRTRKEPTEREVGLSRRKMADRRDGKDPMSAGIPSDIVGITDIGAVGTSVAFEDVKKLPNYSEDFCYVYVSRDRELFTENGWLYLSPSVNGSPKMIAFSSMGDVRITAMTSVIVVGTYEDNPYVGGTDILMPMECYDRLVSRFSVTDDAFYFSRIDEVAERMSQ